MVKQAVKVKRGLDLPIAGNPEQVIYDAQSVKTVALIGSDYHGLRPTMQVKVGDLVKSGQLLFEDKKNSGVRYTAPSAGTVIEINRGYKRVLQSLVIEVQEFQRSESSTLNVDQYQVFECFKSAPIEAYSGEEVKALLIESGLWTALRTRPYSKVPNPETKPHAIFVTAIDTNPLAPNPDVVIADHAECFGMGVAAITKLSELTAAKLYVCRGQQSRWPEVRSDDLKSTHVCAFEGPHPAGLVGTHIHFLDPVSTTKTAWHLNYQDVIAIGYLFKTGQLWQERIVALAGPQVERPRLLRTLLGASLKELIAGEIKKQESRIISGSVLSGRHARGSLVYLGRYHTQVSVLREGRERNLLEYLWPGTQKHSVLNMFLSKLNKHKRFDLSTSTQGSQRAMVPVGAYEKVMPLDILPTQLLRALITGDTEMAQELGCFELDEEDLALCTYACPGKYEYGPILRDVLTLIEKEG